jgi:hypothetical protein
VDTTAGQPLASVTVERDCLQKSLAGCLRLPVTHQCEHRERREQQGRAGGSTGNRYYFAAVRGGRRRINQRQDELVSPIP